MDPDHDQPPPPDATDATAEVPRLFLKHSGAIKGFILALLRNTSLAEDVLQETYLVVTAKAESFRPGSHFVAWAEGRWAGKTALEFREPSDRVRLFVSGEFNTLTLVAWPQ